MCMLSSLISLVGKIWFTQEHSHWIKSDTPPEQILNFIFLFFFIFFTWTGYHFVKPLLFYSFTNQVNNITWKKKQTTYKQTYKIIEEKRIVLKANLLYTVAWQFLTIMIKIMMMLILIIIIIISIIIIILIIIVIISFSSHASKNWMHFLRSYVLPSEWGYCRKQPC